MSNLCIDIGNTRIKWAVFDPGSSLLPARVGVCKRLSQTKLNKWADKYRIKYVLVSSVRGKVKRLKRILEPVFGSRYTLLDKRMPLPIINGYATPNTLGRDRLAASVGAWALFPGRAVLVIDAGTCLTCSFVDAQGVFRGGSIAPGLSMRFQALHLLTAKLPLVQARPEEQAFVGESTQNAILSGVQWGAVHEVDGFIDAYKRQNADLKVLLTGGTAGFFESRLKNNVFVAPHLVLIGLNRILNHQNA